jgi:hypothetical protein
MKTWDITPPSLREQTSLSNNEWKIKQLYVHQLPVAIHAKQKNKTAYMMELYALHFWLNSTIY